MTDKPDYTTMSGAQFQRAVGTDPDKWGAAFCQTVALRGFEPELVGSWFRDAMDAAVRAQGHLLNWDKPDE